MRPDAWAVNVNGHGNKRIPGLGFSVTWKSLFFGFILDGKQAEFAAAGAAEVAVIPRDHLHGVAVGTMSHRHTLH